MEANPLASESLRKVNALRCRVPRAAALCLAFLAGAAGCQSPDVSVRRTAPATAQADAGTPAEVREAVRTLRDGARAPAGSDARHRAAERLLDLYAPAILAAPGHTIRVPDGAGGSVQLRFRRGAGPGGMEPDLFVNLEPADHFTVKSRSGVLRTPGEGVALAGTLRSVLPVSVSEGESPRPIEGIVHAVNALPVARGAREVDFDLYNPEARERPAGVSGPLAGDYTVPLALTLSHFAPQRRGFRGFMSSRDYASTGVYTTEPPSVDKTPLILVHGLVSAPPDLHDLYVRLESDPWVREHYQVWFFYYPSSLPVPWSARLLREDTEKFIRQLDPAGTHPELHRTVLVGHSMGGLLCRLAVSDGGDRYYRHFFKKPLEDLRLSASDRDLMRRTFYYRACPDVAQVVFIATPHGGAGLAGGLLGNMGRLLVRVPVAVKGHIQRIITENRAATTAGTPLKPGSSLDSLTPRDPLIAALRDLPIRPGTGVHSVVGNRGRPGPLECSSDGVVQYKSSHLPQAQSETVVPAGHSGTLQRPETAAEIDRVLHANDPRGAGRTTQAAAVGTGRNATVASAGSRH